MYMSTSKDSVCNDLSMGKSSKCHSPIRPNTCIIQPNSRQLSALQQSNEETSQDIPLEQFGRKVTISIIQASSRSSEHEEYKYENISENIILSRASAKLEFVQPEEMKRRLLTGCQDLSNTFNFDENAMRRVDSRNSQLEKLKLEKRKITFNEEMEIKKVFQNF